MVEIPVDPLLLAAGDHNGSTFYQHQRFQRAVLAEQPPEVGFEDGWWAVAMGLAAQQSARTGKAVELSAETYRRSWPETQLPGMPTDRANKKARFRGLFGCFRTAQDGLKQRIGAQKRTRTSTPFRELRPERSASTNSAIWALARI